MPRASAGVLCALEDAGVAVDVVGGTSQGAFMAGLYAQGLGRERLQRAVQLYAQRLGSVRHLLADLTLPLLSLFSGKAFDETLQTVFGVGAGESWLLLLLGAPCGSPRAVRELRQGHVAGGGAWPGA